MSDPIQNWSKNYRSALGAGPSERTLLAERARLLLAHRGHPKKAILPRVWIASGSLTLALSAIALVFFFGSRPPRLEQAYLGEIPLVQGASIESDIASRTLVFSGGTKAQLNPGAQLTLQEISEQRVLMHLESGVVNFDVEHRPDTKWVIVAGDYRVTVLGTAFTVDQDEQVKVHVTRGKVHVQGGSLPAKGIFLVAGERFVSPLSKEQTPQPSESASEPVSAQEEQIADDPFPTNPGASQKASVNQMAKRTPPRAAPPKTTWKDLAQEGKFAPALAAARRIGISRLIRNADGAELLLLGNAARYGGDLETAELAYQKARKRAPGSSTAALSAYYLSRLSSDHHGDQNQTILWLRTFLREQGSGALAASARARLMTLLEGRGDLTGARQVARAYLKFHPSGPHRDRAERLIGDIPARRAR